MKLDYQAKSVKVAQSPGRFPTFVASVIFANVLVAFAMLIPSLTSLTDPDRCGLLAFLTGLLILFTIFGPLCRTPPKLWVAIALLGAVLLLDRGLAHATARHIAVIERKIGMPLSSLDADISREMGYVWYEYLHNITDIAAVVLGLLWLCLCGRAILVTRHNEHSAGDQQAS